MDKITINGLIHKYANDIAYTEDELTVVIEKCGSSYIACDNRDGCCWVEEFNNYKAAQLWAYNIEEDVKRSSVKKILDDLKAKKGGK